eukprot:3484491-Rhodomonas_salina.1
MPVSTGFDKGENSGSKGMELGIHLAGTTPVLITPSRSREGHTTHVVINPKAAITAVSPSCCTMRSSENPDEIAPDRDQARGSNHSNLSKLLHDESERKSR